MPEDAEAQTFVTQKQPLTIKALGRVWQALFRQSQRTQFGSVVQMLGDLELGKIETIAQLRSRLEDDRNLNWKHPNHKFTHPMEEKDTTASPLSCKRMN